MNKNPQLMNVDNPNLPGNTQEDELLLLEALAAVYVTAADNKEYVLAKLLRDQVEILVAGKTLGIKIENSLNLNGN